ncbi:MAG: tetratricopeptide repeat protein [Lentisphaerae bacterium]|nr:tetratricopeptide repeat protein [Lentisphaerota bacterium]
MKRIGYATLLCLCLALCIQSAATETDLQLNLRKAYDSLVKADEARDRNELDNAGKCYRAALTAYRAFSASYPDVHPRVVKFRIAYCEEQLQAIIKNDGYSEHENAVATPESDTTNFADETYAAQSKDEQKTDIARIKSAAWRLLIQGKTEKAYDLAMLGLQLDPDEPAMRLLAGTAQCQTGRFQEAIELLSRLTLEAPENARIRVTLATAYFGQNDVQRAKEQLEQALTIDPNMKEAHFNLAQVLLMLNPPDQDSAAAHYRQALKLGAQPDATLTALLD